MTLVHGTQGKDQTESVVMCMHKALDKWLCEHAADFSLELHATYSGLQASITFWGDSPVKTKLIFIIQPPIISTHKTMLTFDKGLRILTAITL